jgi:hypothetical protein
MKRLPRLGVVSLLAAALMALATPARADDPAGDLAFPRFTANMPAAWHVLNKKLWVDGCDGCPGPLAVDVTEFPALLPQHEDEYLDSLTNGLTYLHDAAQTSALDRKQVLRTAAMQSFAKAAWRLGRSTVSLRRVGIADLARNVFEPTANPWLTAAGIDVSDGLTIMQDALPPGYDGRGAFPPAPPWKDPIIVQPSRSSTRHTPN